jgi:plasmid replication initiation protein
MSDLTIYKHNELIENFVFNATYQELQILNYAVVVTNPLWENKNLVYQIDIPALVSTYATKSNSAYKDYRNALDRMMKRTYSYYSEGENKKTTENLVTSITIDMSDNSYLVFKFNEYISKRICNLKGLFTKYDIKHISMFKSRYAFMLYEFFKMGIDQANFQDSPIYRKKISVADFKENLGLIGKYEIFRNLETKVLKVAKKNINDHSDISMSYTVTRKARTPTHIVLSAQYKKGEGKNTAEDQAEIPDLDNPDENYIQATAEKIAQRKADLKNILK